MPAGPAFEPQRGTAGLARLGPGRGLAARKPGDALTKITILPGRVWPGQVLAEPRARAPSSAALAAPARAGRGARGPRLCQMRRPFRAAFQRACVFERDLAQALGLEGLLRQGHAAVEDLRVAFDAVSVEVEPANAVEGDACPFGFRARRCETEAIAGIADRAADDGIVEFPAKIAPAFGEMRQHLLDLGAAEAGCKKIIVVGALRREQIRQGIAIAGGGRGGKTINEFGKGHGFGLSCLLARSG